MQQQPTPARVPQPAPKQPAPNLIPCYVLQWSSPGSTGIVFWYFSSAGQAKRAQAGLQPGCKSRIQFVMINGSSWDVVSRG